VACPLGLGKVSYSYSRVGLQKRLEQSQRQGRRISILGLWQPDRTFEYALACGSFADPQGTATRWAASAEDEKPFPSAVIGLSAANEKVHREVKKFIGDYDCILIDCPPDADSPVPQSALLIADLALVPIIPSPLDLWAAVGIRQVIVNDRRNRKANR
jgi:hypothetical protein